MENKTSIWTKLLLVVGIVISGLLVAQIAILNRLSGVIQPNGNKSDASVSIISFPGIVDNWAKFNHYPIAMAQNSEGQQYVVTKAGNLDQQNDINIKIYSIDNAGATKLVSQIVKDVPTGDIEYIRAEKLLIDSTGKLILVGNSKKFGIKLYSINPKAPGNGKMVEKVIGNTIDNSNCYSGDVAIDSKDDIYVIQCKGTSNTGLTDKLFYKIAASGFLRAKWNFGKNASLDFSIDSVKGDLYTLGEFTNAPVRVLYHYANVNGIYSLKQSYSVGKFNGTAVWADVKNVYLSGKFDEKLGTSILNLASGQITNVQIPTGYDFINNTGTVGARVNIDKDRNLYVQRDLYVSTNTPGQLDTKTCILKVSITGTASLYKTCRDGESLYGSRIDKDGNLYILNYRDKSGNSNLSITKISK